VSLLSRLDLALLRQPAWRGAALAALWLALAGLGAQTQARPTQSADAESGTVQLSALPREAQKTYELILAGGPFPHSQDGIVFGNYEHQLPAKARGYYHEYTVQTPGAHNRGARRIVCGGDAPTRPDRCYYTDDHYASFRQLVQSVGGRGKSF